MKLCSWGVGQPWNWAAPAGHLWRTKGDICGPGHADYQNATWLSVKVTQSGKSQTFANTIHTAGLTSGHYHAVVRADNTEPVSGQPISAL